MVVDSATSSLDWERCSTTGCRGVRSGEGGVCLAHLPRRALEAELARFGRGRPFDARGVDFEEGLWDRVVASAALDPLGRRRLSTARFDMATFEGPVSLDGALFTRDASFAGAHFRGPVSFRQTRVVGQARFSDAVFEGTADFGSATFEGPAWFAGATFRQPAGFVGAHLAAPAWFTAAQFEGGASFSGASFARHASFDRGRFGGQVDFEGAEFVGDVDLDTATFAHPADFGGTVFKGGKGVPSSAPRKAVRWSGAPLARWRQRAGARLIDAAVLVGAVAVGIAASLGLRALQEGALAAAAIVSGVIAAVLLVIRQVADEGSTGQTMGKRRMGLRVVSERLRQPVGARRAAMRLALHLVDTLPIGAGWLWPLRDPKRQTFADKVAGTVVIVVGRGHRQPPGGCGS